MEVEGQRENLEGLQVGKTGLGMALGSLDGRSRGQRSGAGKMMRKQTAMWSWELPCWGFPYCLSVCHGISRPNKEEFK